MKYRQIYENIENIYRKYKNMKYRQPQNTKPQVVSKIKKTFNQENKYTM